MWRLPFVINVTLNLPTVFLHTFSRAFFEFWLVAFFSGVFVQWFIRYNLLRRSFWRSLKGIMIVDSDCVFVAGSKYLQFH